MVFKMIFSGSAVKINSFSKFTSVKNSSGVDLDKTHVAMGAAAFLASWKGRE